MTTATKTHRTTRKAIAAAYDAWKGKGRVTTTGGAPKAFRKALGSYLRLRGWEGDADQLPGSKTTWSDWRHSDEVVTLPHGLCGAIHGVAGVDLTTDGCFSDEVNRSDLVTLTGAPTLRTTGNEPVEDEVRCEVGAPRIVFRKGPVIRVTEDWDMGQAGRKDIDIGGLTVGLLAAEISLTGPARIEPLLEEAAAGTDSHAVRASGLDIADDPRQPGRWRVTAPEGAEGRMLNGSVTVATLANVWLPPAAQVTLTVAAPIDAIQTEFTPNAHEQATEDRRSRIRTQMINALMRSFLTETNGRLTLSEASACRD